MQFGVLVTPFHPVGENPTAAFTRDLELIEWVERLGYDEAWVGEHHSGGWGTIASPEVFLANAAARTSRIRLGTGVVSLPYHHPLMVADRMVLLDHLAGGRVMFGVGAGVLPSDAHMIGIEQGTQRRMMQESLDAIVQLFTRDEPITIETDWFSLRDAALQLRPFTEPHMPIAVASSASPAGMALAGQYGAGALSLAGFSPAGLGQLAGQWAVAEESARRHRQRVDRRNWRIVVPVHVAPTRQEATADIREGGRQLLVDYFHKTLGRPLAGDADDGEAAVDAMIESGTAIIGDPDDCCRAIQRLQDLTGGFGTLVAVSLDWAPRAQVWRSFEMLARYVAPQFQGSLDRLRRSQEWVANNGVLV
jgi:limonene 1,2-monooxygenase